MNLLILEASELSSTLDPGDRRVRHVAKVLGKKVGDEIAVGLRVEDPFGPAPGSIGTARIERLDEGGMILSYRPEREAPALRPIRLILGFPRPIQGGRLLKDLASLGVAEIVLCGTELGEKSYLESDLWKKAEYRLALLEGAEQAANPRVPRASREWSLRAALQSLREAEAGPVRAAAPDGSWADGSKICLHPSLAGRRLGGLRVGGPLTLAIGSERGWTEAELRLFEEGGFGVASLGERILKTETAAVAAVSIALSLAGFL